MNPEISFASASVPPDLVPYVRSLQGARLRGGAPARQLELPVAGTAVIVELTERWEIGVRDGTPLVGHRSFAGGLTLGPAVSAHRGAYELVEFVLTPLGTVAVLGLPPVEITDEVVAFDALLGAEAERLGERLAACAHWGGRFAETERWLRARVAASRALVSPDVGWALRRLDATGGRLRIGELQRELGCSRRHLATRFAAGVGVTPKRYAQLVRFGEAVTRLRAGAAPGEVAAGCGYADQAHLTREVRRFGATTPGGLRADG
ncbi:MAG: helix-turn-helix transcriptional regulator [Solirubrobacterales bacterium]|nr:helix-turn-helix transcriptional regulator [Solirubrobacterales bacterium]